MKKGTQEVTPCNVPTPQPHHTKSLGTNARNSSEVVMGGGSEGGGNEGGVAIDGGNKGGVATDGGNKGGFATCGGSEGGGSANVVVEQPYLDIVQGNLAETSVSGTTIDKGKGVIEKKKKYPPKYSARQIIDDMEFLPLKKNESPWDCLVWDKLEAEEEFENLMVPEQRLRWNRVKSIIIPEKVGLYAYEENRPMRSKRFRSPSSSDDSDTPSGEHVKSKHGKGGRGGGKKDEKGGRGRGEKGGRAGKSSRGGRGGSQKTPIQGGSERGKKITVC
ncbi:H/ACA ribonucleoprotein complex subunit 1-like [Papaver somniferum]|uniref:H/ACA ribonucleoprotein complex subunit 1-like n=1 Tax=Papaver somniferum TaxID=3469 RepID=UPI000E6FF918|nr:H/ACA ribonucleoprotein complex subunit 1-like [Papaver somniferum]